MASQRIVVSSSIDRKWEFPVLNARRIHEHLCEEFSRADSGFVPELVDIESPKASFEFSEAVRTFTVLFVTTGQIHGPPV